MELEEEMMMMMEHGLESRRSRVCPGVCMESGGNGEDASLEK